VQIVVHTVLVVVEEDLVASVTRARRRLFLGICERVRDLDWVINLAGAAKRKIQSSDDVLGN